MKILITGASSYVGARLFLDLSKVHDVIGTYKGSKLSDKFIPLDITDAADAKRVIDKQQPDIILHAAASADARWCEANPEEAVKLNQESTRNIVEIANKAGSKIIFISSYAAINPINVYGRTKHESESHVKHAKNGYIILRPSLIIGFSPNAVNDRPFNRILKNLDQKTEAIYDTSWKFQPSYLGHISEVIIDVLSRKIINETIPIAVSDLKTRYDIAIDILKPFNIDVVSVDKQDNTPVVVEDLKKLDKLNLPKYSYEEIIAKIIDEIRHREIFTKI